MMPSERPSKNRLTRMKKREESILFLVIHLSKSASLNPSTFRQHLWTLREALKGAKAHEDSLMIVQEKFSSLL